MKVISLTHQARHRIDELGQEFLIEFLSRETARKPTNVDALAELGHVLTQLGRFEDGLRIDQRLVRIAPENPIAYYNLACSLALLERREDALDALDRAVELGYRDLEHLLSDEDLVALRGEMRFEEIARRLGPSDRSRT